jgi:uncharacterized protein YbjT (DUF2867 family)
MKIAVTGSLGHISKPMSIKLLQKGHEVTIVSSNADRRDDIVSLGATAAIGDLLDRDFLLRTFQGMDLVYTMIPPDFRTADPIQRYADIGEAYAGALSEAGIKKVVHLSSWGADKESGTGFIVGSHLVEKIFDRLSGISMTYLRPASFYYNLYAYKEMIRYTGVIATNYGDDDSLVMVSPTDIAEAAVEEIENFSEGKKIRYVASDERSCNEIAAVLGQAIGKPDLKWKRATREETLASLTAHMPLHFAEKLVELNESIRTGWIREDYNRNKPEKMGAVKLEDFAEEFKLAYQVQ